MSKNHLIGVHLSIAQGWEILFKDAVDLDCTAVQFFIKNARQWKASLFDQSVIDSFKAAYQQTAIRPLICHASYLINIVSANPLTASNSKESLLNELMLCDQLGIDYLVLHPGTNPNPNKKEVIQFFTTQLDEVLHLYKGSTMLVLENSAGQGNYLGSTFEQLSLMKSLNTYKHKIGFCLDTCHVFSAGYYNFDSHSDYEKLWNDWNSLIGIEHLKVIHLNDSAKPQGSHIDRHAEIGKGFMPLWWFECLINDDKLSHIPKILETPKKTIDDDRRNLEVVNSLIK